VGLGPTHLVIAALGPSERRVIVWHASSSHRRAWSAPAGERYHDLGGRLVTVPDPPQMIPDHHGVGGGRVGNHPTVVDPLEQPMETGRHPGRWSRAASRVSISCWTNAESSWCYFLY